MYSEDTRKAIKDLRLKKSVFLPSEEEYEIIKIPKSLIPKGAELMECYRTAHEIIVCGWPEDDDETHDCDQMGCSTVNHVLYRFRI